MGTRAGFLERAAREFSMPVPDGYPIRFDTPAETADPAERFLIEKSDAATAETVPRLQKEVADLAAKLDFPKLSSEATERCLGMIKGGVPAEGVGTLANIVNAGWTAYRDETAFTRHQIGDRRRIDVLNEILLKTIEVMEFEDRMRN